MTRLCSWYTTVLRKIQISRSLELLCFETYCWCLLWKQQTKGRGLNPECGLRANKNIVWLGADKSSSPGSRYNQASLLTEKDKSFAKTLGTDKWGPSSQQGARGGSHLRSTVETQGELHLGHKLWLLQLRNDAPRPGSEEAFIEAHLYWRQGK